MESEPSTSASIVQIMSPPEDSEDRVIEELRRVPLEDASSDQLLHDSTDDVDNLMQQGSVGSHHSQQSTSHEPTPIQMNSAKKNVEPAVKKLLDQERFLPIANVVRLMKRQMDPNAKLAKDAKECVQECTSEFISFIAAEAADMCGQQKRKTILADDLLTAMESLGFDNYAEPMRIFLQKYRQVHKITGPYHHEHPNYRRPAQFENDPPVAPLFFTSDHGERRCTETKYVINKTEVIKNAPFDGEWNEQTGEHSGNLVEREQRDEMDDDEVLYEGTTMDGLPVVETEEIEGEEEADDSTMGMALEQQNQMQIYYDPKSKQHYAAKETPNGMELYPLVIDNNPLQLENIVAEPNQFVVSSGDGEGDEEDPSFAEDDTHIDSNQPSTSSAMYQDDQQPHSSHQYYPQQQFHQMSSSRPQRQRHQNRNHHNQPKRRKMVVEEYDPVHDDYEPQNSHGAMLGEDEEDHLEPLGDSTPSHQASGPIPTLNSLAKPPRTQRPVPPHRAVMAAPRPPSAGKRTPQKRKK